MPSASDAKSTRVVKELFGTQVQEQGKGFYVSLEFFAIIRGVIRLAPTDLLSPSVDVITYERISHDFARRVATHTVIDNEQLARAVQGTTTLETLDALLSSLVVEIPGRRKEPEWFAAHFYPFVGELVHYDAVRRGGHRQPSIERYLFRDGGGWAYHVLRKDPDVERRTQSTELLRVLMDDSGSALGRVVKALHTHDLAQAARFNDISEAETDDRDEASPWPDFLRRGVNRIAARTKSPRAKRIEQLMNWIPYCLARHELALARLELRLDREIITVDATRDTANQLRVHSQNILNQYSWQIAEALTVRALALMEAETATEGREQWRRLTEPNASFTKSPKGFFLGTLGAVGALNAVAGRRHFVFKPPILEALVCATLQPEQEMEYNAFLNRLYGDYSIVISDRTAARTGLTMDIDAAVFSANSLAFKERLEAAGLLTHYSDASRLVHGETR